VLTFVIVRVTLYESPKGRVQQNRTILLVKKCKLDSRLLDEDQDRWNQLEVELTCHYFGGKFNWARCQNGAHGLENQDVS
jgi:hypothetical protein